MEIFLDSENKMRKALCVFFNHCKQYLASQGYIVFPHRDFSFLAVKKGGYMLLQASIKGFHEKFWRDLREASARAFCDIPIGLIHPQFDFTFIDGREYVRLFLEKPVIKNSLIIQNIYGEEHPKIAVVSSKREFEFIKRA
jgi:hypothetical protein